MDPGKLSDKQLAGQRLMVGFDGTRFNEDLRRLIDELMIGGVILFAGNIETPEQIQDLCFSIQDYAGSRGQPPLFIAIDQEGGRVARLKEPFSRFPGNPHMKDENDAVHFAQVTAAELTQVGINMNMAPVMDVAPSNVNSVMAERVFGSDPQWVSRLGVKVIEHLQINNIISVAKHFPGIGRTTLDSHLDLPVLETALPELLSFDLIPFEDSIRHGVAGIMMSHIFYEKIDPQWPASLSRRIAFDLLRRRLGFSGVSFTDDLDMGAITRHYDIRKVIRQVLSAEIDVVLICHKGPNIDIAFEEILKGLTISPEIKAKGMESVQRIMALKSKYLRGRGVFR